MAISAGRRNVPPVVGSESRRGGSDERAQIGVPIFGLFANGAHPHAPRHDIEVTPGMGQEAREQRSLCRQTLEQQGTVATGRWNRPGDVGDAHRDAPGRSVANRGHAPGDVGASWSCRRPRYVRRGYPRRREKVEGGQLGINQELVFFYWAVVRVSYFLLDRNNNSWLQNRSVQFDARGPLCRPRSERGASAFQLG